MAEQLIIMDRNHWRFPRMRGDRPPSSSPRRSRVLRRRNCASWNSGWIG